MCNASIIRLAVIPSAQRRCAGVGSAHLPCMCTSITKCASRGDALLYAEHGFVRRDYSVVSYPKASVGVIQTKTIRGPRGDAEELRSMFLLSSGDYA
jgi:hypothetical protein